MIVYFDEFEKVSDNTYTFLYNLLPDSRKQKIKQKSIKKDQKIAIIEYFLVKKLLKLKKCPDFEYTKFGKPYIKNKHFSISHSDSFLVVATAKKELGVDVQKLIEYNDKLAKYVCNDKEYKKISTAKNKSLEFTKLWTKKESYIKLLGKTVFCDLKNLLNNNNCKFKFDYVKNYVICVCKQKSTQK
ncbi:MAG: 4'-phosphopantetheinyl transferase superfamily protein [Clostridia bacterium]|nr:4'-phosphopantetheinyl transferase superfamily protein [Clostridia bacterium]